MVALGGSAATTGGSRGTGGLHALDDEGTAQRTWTMGGGGGGAGGGFGGAASNIGTGGQGGGGSAGTIQSTLINNAFYQVGALGGNPGTNADGTPASDAGESTLLNEDNESLMAQRTYLLTPDADYIYYRNIGWQNGDNRAAGGTGGTTGAATTGGSASNVTVDWPTQGRGTEGDPVIISSAADWNNFATSVNNGADCSGVYLQLTADISVSTKCGTVSGGTQLNAFSGIFLGNGKTITATITDNDNQGTALFCNINGATIKDLTVAGTVASDERHIAGLVGFTKGTNRIEDCTVTATLNVSTDYAGGIVGHGLDSNTTIEGCVFAGTINAIGSNNPNVGALWGWSDSGIPTLVNCLEAGTYSNVSKMHPMGLQNNVGTITNCYYLNAQMGSPSHACTVSGAKQAYAFATTPANLGSLVQDYSTLTAYENGILYSGTYYVASTGNISLTVEGYGDGNDKWAFIASPVEGSIAPTTVGNIFSATEYDLYQLNPSTVVWENYKAHDGNANPGFSLENGQGYLYATKETKNLVFSGTFNTGTTKEITGLPEGYNLVGNPFVVDAYVSKPYYTLNAEGSAILSTTSTAAIAPCHGVIVEAGDDESVTFSTKAPTQQNAANNNGGLQIALSQANPSLRGTKQSSTIDNAIVSFNEGSQLGKFYFGTQNANVYIPQDGKEYAVVSVGRDAVRHVSTTEMPVNFKAKVDGEYTLTVNPEGVNMAYLHLIDNMTGSDVDLLSPAGSPFGKGAGGFNEPSYTFTAKTTDYASRFRLVFAAGDVAGGDACEPSFAYINGNGEIVLTDADASDASLQVVDVMGRVLICRDAARHVSTTGMTPGVYVLRLINGNDVKTQKIVVE